MKAYLKLAALFLVLFLYPYGADSQAQEKDALNGYAIHVTYRDLTIMFQPMYGSKYQGAGGFTTSSTLVVKRAAEDSERVSYISVAAMIQGERWSVTVSLKFGEFYDKGEKRIATYQIREGEKAKVKELAQYGIEPIDVSVVKVVRTPAIQPKVINRTNSIVVVNVKTGDLPLPYRIVLKNISDKPVQALEVVTSNGKGMFALKWPEGTLDGPLIGAGQEYQLEMPSEREYRSLPTGEYAAEQFQIIEINTVVFTDSTYEGNLKLAMLQMAKNLGNRVQIERILSLIQGALGTTSDDESAFDQFKRDVSALDEFVDAALFVELMSQFPTMDEQQKDNMRRIVRRNLHDIKGGLSRSIADFERESSQMTDKSFKAWLKKIKERYEEWRSNLP
jgi:hypothetical protein